MKILNKATSQKLSQLNSKDKTLRFKKSHLAKATKLMIKTGAQMNTGQLGVI